MAPRGRQTDVQFLKCSNASIAWNLERHREAHGLIKTPKFQLVETERAAVDGGVEWLARRPTKVFGRPKTSAAICSASFHSASRPFRCTGLIR